MLNLVKTDKSEVDTVADLRGAQGTRAPPGGPNSFNFMQFLGKFDKFLCWRPPGELAPPPRGNPGSATVTYSVDHRFQQKKVATKINNILWLQQDIRLFRK